MIELKASTLIDEMIDSLSLVFYCSVIKSEAI